MNRTPRQYARPRHFRLSIVFALVAPLALASSGAHAAEKHWAANNGLWNNGANWSPAGVPVNYSDIYIGNIPGVQNNTVYMGFGINSAALNSLELSNGMTLDLNGSQLESGTTHLLGAGTRLICRPGPGGTYVLWTMIDIGAGAHLELVDNALIHLQWNSWNHGLISGRGAIDSLIGLRNDGVIRPGNNGGISLESTAGPMDLDGSSGDGHLQLDIPFSQLLITTGLTDPFSGLLTMAPGALLTMNDPGGWDADAGAKFDILGANNPAASQIDGTRMTFGGELNIGANQAHLRVLANATLTPSTEVNIAAGGWLEFISDTNSVEGGNYTLGQDARLNFDGAFVSGGTFTTPSNDPGDGVVEFNSTTYWNGTVNVNGVVHLNGNLAEVLGTTVINAQGSTFAMDGGLWGIGYNFTVNAAQISTSLPNHLDGQIIIPGGLVPRLTINLTDPNASWSMNGLMNLRGQTVLYETRVAGSHMLVNGTLDLSEGRVNITADTTFSPTPAGAEVNIEAASAVLRMMGDTFVGGETSFTGLGTLRNGPNGGMTLDDGVLLGDIGLVNEGSLFIRRDDNPDLAGLVSVDRFTNLIGADWYIRIGGYTLGQDYDHIVVTNGPATLNGNLQIAQFDANGVPFSPQVGDEFTILTAVGGVSGNLVVVPGACINGDSYLWSVLYGPNDVRVRLDSISGMPGDMNCDCRVNGLDIQPFVYALLYPETYASQYPDCDVLHGDTNGNGIVDFDDCEPFVQLVLGTP